MGHVITVQRLKSRVKTEKNVYFGTIKCSKTDYMWGEVSYFVFPFSSDLEVLDPIRKKVDRLIEVLPPYLPTAAFLKILNFEPA